jgi:hypothetical protein
MDRFWQFWAQVELWHGRHTGRVWLAPMRLSPYILFLIIAGGLVAGLMSWSVRDSQYQQFQQYDGLFQLDDGTALFTTTDAPYFVGIAQALKQSGSARPFSQRRLYPEYHLNPPETADNGIFDAPLLSVIIASFSSDDSYPSLFRTAHAMIPLTAFFTAVMIMIGFGAAGFWLEGAWLSRAQFCWQNRYRPAESGAVISGYRAGYFCCPHCIHAHGDRPEHGCRMRHVAVPLVV